MKTNEMNLRQKKAFRNIKYAFNWLLGGLENTLMDYNEDSDEYKQANDLLNNHEELVNELYSMATTAIYEEGLCCFNKETVKYELRDINFCGKQFLMECCENRITKEGY